MGIAGNDSFAAVTGFDQHHALDQLHVETPEQVDIRFPIAGIGSRFLAVLTDTVLIFGFYALLFLIAAATISGGDLRNSHPSSAENWLIAGFIFINFLVIWGYFALFEAFWKGQTPGKRLLKIRVIKQSGRGITLFEALARNLLRIVDFFPSLYLVGAIAMLCNRSQQRLGDMVAGTIVIHERSHEQPPVPHNSRTFTSHVFEQPVTSVRLKPIGTHVHPIGDQTIPTDAVARLNVEDLHLIDTFFARALDLSMEKRAELARRVLVIITARMQLTISEAIEPEQILEYVAHEMRGQGRA